MGIIWVGTIVLIAGLLAADLWSARKDEPVSLKKAGIQSVLYISIAVLFGVGVWVFGGSQVGTEFFTAYLVEKSLSIDNLFVFAIILAKFAVPAGLQQRVLVIGIILALVFRAVFIAIGAAALQYFAFTFVIFGALLLWTGIQLLRNKDEDPDINDNPLVRLIKKRYRVSAEYHGHALTIREQGKKVLTPLLLVIVAIGTTDILFALDSIPATFGITTDAYLVFTVNAFALLGLRALYFLIHGLLGKLIYLSTGLAVILIFIGLKLVATFAHEYVPTIPHVSPIVSLIVILVILTVTTVASLIVARKHPERVAHAGTVVTPKPDEDDEQ